MNTGFTEYEHVLSTESGQDGAIYGDYLFRFHDRGLCDVYSMTDKSKLTSFELDKMSILSPHSNAVCFGTEFYEDKDEFPLLYSNIYNNYGKEADRLEGVCCVYRITRDGNSFASKLVQVIKIGFVEELDYWKSYSGTTDVRPYGNFVVDTDHSKLYAFTMRDRDSVTRYFKFDLPKAADGTYSQVYGANVVTLQIGDIESWFDCEYSRFLQGACYHDNKIYSLEGFNYSPNTEKPGKLKVIDLEKQEQLCNIDLHEIGLDAEPEFMEYYNGIFYYSDSSGKVVAFISH